MRKPNGELLRLSGYASMGKIPLLGSYVDEVIFRLERLYEIANGFLIRRRLGLRLLHTHDDCNLIATTRVIVLRYVNVVYLGRELKSRYRVFDSSNVS